MTCIEIVFPWFFPLTKVAHSSTLAVITVGSENKRKLKVCLYVTFLSHARYYHRYSCFSDFVFKIRLNRLGFFFQSQSIMYLSSQPTDSKLGVLTTTSQSQL